jgi:two-component system chemotaxis response regulator CheB
MEEGGNLRYRCHTGHAYSQASLLADQSVAVEESIYVALRSVEEKAAVLRRLAAHATASPVIGADYETRARELDTAAETLRSILAREK